jgi:hypothetical protein
VATAVVGFFDSVGKVVGAIAGVFALATALGVFTLGGADEAPTTSAVLGQQSASTAHERLVDTSEIVVESTVPSLQRQDDAQSANDYTPDNLVDGDVRTAWVEGVHGLGTAARLTFRLPRTVDLARIRVVNGYAKSNATFLDNAAPRSVLVRSSGMKTPARWRLAHDSRPQSLRTALGMTRRVTIEIVSAYRGDRFEDLAISEIWFFANER